MQSKRLCEKCGADTGSSALGVYCLRCMMAEGLEPGSIAASDTHRLNNPLFVQSFGDYELLEEIARGGMGVVYKARQRSLGRLVAVKVLSAGEFASPEFVQRFRTEATAAARLQHPNIVAIHEVGEQDGIRYLSMEYVQGPNLAQLQAQQAITIPRAATYLKTLADAIQYAHQKGILHRDLKPSNVLIDPFGEPRITDFGLAKEMTGDSDLTVTGQVLGTPGYLPPEQADSTCGPATPAADVYSLGAILYFMLTSRPPFFAGTLQETLRQVLHNDPVAPTVLNPEVPKDLETICLKCLERDPGRRYPSAAALSEDLRRFISGEPIVARPLSTTGRLTRWCRRRPTLAAVWVLVAALALGSMVSAFWIHHALSQTEIALKEAKEARITDREHLREARLAQARAVRRATKPGRRKEALAALAEANRVKPGADLRDEAVAALLTHDIEPAEKWEWGFGVPVMVWFDPLGKTATVEIRSESTGKNRDPLSIRRWGGTNIIAMADAPTNVVGRSCFSQNGALLMTRLLDNTARIWQVGRNDPILTLSNRPLPGGDLHTESYNNDYDLMPDGSLCVLGLPTRGLSLNRVSDGSEVARWDDGDLFNQVRISPDGKRLAATQITMEGPRRVFILKLPEMALERTVPLTEIPHWINWSSDSRVVAVALADNTIAMIDARDGRVLKNLRHTELGPGEDVFLGHDALLACRGAGTTLRFIDTVTGLEQFSIEGYSSASLAAKPEGETFVVTTIDGISTRWRVLPPTGYKAIPAPKPNGYELGISTSCMEFTPDGRHVISSHGRYTIIRDLATGRLEDEWDSGYTGLAWGTIALSDDGHSLIRCSTATGLERRELIKEPSGRLAFGATRPLDSERGFQITDRSSDGSLLAMVNPVSGDVRVTAINEESARTVSRWKTHDAYAAALSPDGQRLLLNCAALGTNGPNLRIRVHRVTDGSVINELSAPGSCDAVWSSNGKVAMTSNGQKRSTIWDATTWKPSVSLTGELGGDVTTFALAPDGSYAVISHGNSVSLVSTQGGETITTIDCSNSTGFAAGIRFLPDGKTFGVMWRDGRIDLFSPETIREALRPLGLAW